MGKAQIKRPASLVIAEAVREERTTGRYDEVRKTWSDRKYELAATKKHNEGM